MQNILKTYKKKWEDCNEEIFKKAMVCLME